MTSLATLFLLVTATALLALPRRWAPFPLLVGACYMTLGQGIEVGPFSFPIIRLLILVGGIRVLARHERPVGGLVSLDWLMMAWAVWGCCCSAFHKQPTAYLVGQMGLIYNILGIYFLIRCFCRSIEDILGMVKMIAVLLAPVAVEMVHEQLTGHNLFAIFGGIMDAAAVRNGRVRSQGPFAHAILGGTVGAVCAPLMVGIWRQAPRVAKLGLASCLLMIITSSSSGPLMSLMCSGLAILLWRWRHFTRQIRIAAVVVYVLLDLAMKAPAYYLIARIDLTGGSTGWHRAALIQASIEHLREWWFAGTDYTAHWMPTGVYWSEDHTDITNQYIKMGVLGGLPFMLLFIAFLWRGFRSVGETLRQWSEAPWEDQFLVWSLGASLFAHAATCVSVTYFDQSFVFLYSNLAVLASLGVVASQAPSLDASLDARAVQSSSEGWAQEVQTLVAARELGL